jgi:hypothetical protein
MEESADEEKIMWKTIGFLKFDFFTYFLSHFLPCFSINETLFRVELKFLLD